MRKVVLLAILVVLASWYFHFGRQMSQASVSGYYREQLQMMAQFEAEQLCSTMDEQYVLNDVTFSSAGTRRRAFDKHQACEELKEGLDDFRKLSDLSRGLLSPSFRSDIKSITLSDDAKLATVEGTSTVKMGQMLLGRTRFTEKLVRRNGTIRSLGGETKSWVYGDD
jgi:hypothetical protein